MSAAPPCCRAGAGLVERPDGRALARPACGRRSRSRRGRGRIADWRAAAARSAARTAAPGRGRRQAGRRVARAAVRRQPRWRRARATARCMRPGPAPTIAADHGLLIAADAGCTHLTLLPLPRSGGLTGVYNVGSRDGPVALAALEPAWLDHIGGTGAGQRRAAAASCAPAACRRRRSAHGLEQPALLPGALAGAGGGQRTSLRAGDLPGDRCRRARQPERKARRRGGRRGLLEVGSAHRSAGAGERFLRAPRRGRIRGAAACDPTAVRDARWPNAFLRPCGQRRSPRAPVVAGSDPGLDRHRRARSGRRPRRHGSQGDRRRVAGARARGVAPGQARTAAIATPPASCAGAASATGRSARRRGR